MMGANKITAAVIALVAICIASFVVVRQLAKGEQINNPTIAASPVVTLQQEPASATVSETTPPDTIPSQSIAAETESTENTVGLFTTYPMESIAPISTTVLNTTTAAPLTSSSASTSTTKAPTTTKKTTTKTTTAKNNAAASTDPNIAQAAKENDGFLGYLYNETGNYYYTTKDPWQRVFGFNAAYDFGAQFVFMYFDTARIKFKYDNKDWMVEVWKGQYGAVFIGSEIGVYYKPQDRTVEHYDCVSDEDALYMEMSLFRNGEQLFSREYTKYWWCTGFVPGKLKKYSDRSELTLKARITLNNRVMLNAFVSGLKSCNEYEFVEGKNYKISGLDVFINW